MTRFSKPTTGAFILDFKKKDEFLAKPKDGYEKLLARFYTHKPNKGVIVPNKK